MIRNLKKYLAKNKINLIYYIIENYYKGYLKSYKKKSKDAQLRM